MNTYLYAKLEDNENSIEKICARNFEECQIKIKEHYTNMYDDLDDLEDYEDFIFDLFELHDIFIGKIYESDELI